jgi:hypothetical protein
LLYPPPPFFFPSSFFLPSIPTWCTLGRVGQRKTTLRMLVTRAFAADASTLATRVVRPNAMPARSERLINRQTLSQHTRITKSIERCSIQYCNTCMYLVHAESKLRVATTGSRESKRRKMFVRVLDLHVVTNNYCTKY